MLARLSLSLSWARIRLTIVVLGASFVAASLAGACLDYAGEDLFTGCTTTTTVVIVGSGSGVIVPDEEEPEPDAGTDEDCGAPVVPSGSGS